MENEYKIYFWLHLLPRSGLAEMAENRTTEVCRKAKKDFCWIRIP